MKHSLSLGMAVAIVAAAGSLSAQDLYSNSLSYPNNRMLLSLKMRNAPASATLQVTTSPVTPPLLTVNAPSTVITDANGYASFVVDVTGIVPTSAPQQLTITVSGGGLPAPLSKDYLLQSANGQLTSAWPELLQIEGVFCNPTNAASTQLEISRATDLDGDGLYGDVIIEAALNGLDQLDFPSEFSMDINTTGTSGCIGGVPAGVFRPGAPTRPNVAFAADNRQVLGPCSFTSKMNYVQDMTFGSSFGGSPALLFTSSDSDVVYIGRDANGDGTIEDAEMPVFFDPLTVVNNENYSSDGVAIDPTGTRRAYWISDKSGATGSTVNQGLFQLTDANGDDKIGVGEWVASWVGSTPTVMVAGQPIDPSEFEGLHVDASGGVLVNQVDLGTIFRWVDSNNNGIAETGEVVNWLTYNTASALPVSQDFAQNSSFPTFGGPYFPMNLISSVAGVNGVQQVWFVGSDDLSGLTKGYVFRCQDNNADGDVNDLGEVSFFVDPLQVNDPFPPNGLSGMDAVGVDVNGDSIVEDDELFVYGASPAGPPPSCGFPFGDLTNWRFHDANGDGDSFDSGEAQRVSIHPTGAYNRGLIVIPGRELGGFQHTFYSRSRLVTTQPAACTTSSGRYLEIDFLRDKIEEGTQGTPFAGNQRFVVVTRGNPPAAFPNAGIALAGAPAMPLPLFGCTLGLGAPIIIGLIPPAMPDPQGEAQFPLPIPMSVYGTVYFQAFAVDGPSVKLGEVAEVRLW